VRSSGWAEAVVASVSRVREVADPKCRCAGAGRPRWILETPRSALPGPLRRNIRLEQERLCLLVGVGVRADGTKELIALTDDEQKGFEALFTVNKAVA